MKIILYVPQPDENSSVQAGGQYTAAKGFIDYLVEIEYPFVVINTTPLKTNQSRLSKTIFSFFRMIKVINISWKEKSIIFAFTGSFFSIMERFILSFLSFGDLALAFRNSEILNVTPSSLKGQLISFALKRAKVVFVQGENLKYHMQSFGVDISKIQVIPNWLPSHYYLGEQKVVPSSLTTVNFIMVSRIVKAKGIFEFIKAVNLLGDLKFKVKVNILGGGDDLIEAKDYCKLFNLSQIVKFHGWVGNDETKRALSNSHVFVLPSYNEGFPNSILEAMAFGLPIISTDVGAISESVIDGVNGFIVNVQDPISLSTSLSRYIVTPHLIQQHSIESLNIVRERHNRSENCKKIVHYLCRLDL
jgi:glycosyltransferase involved in cell wall biosynthesis